MWTVTSLAEVWIEMLVVVRTGTEDDGHFPCGSVDWNVQMNCLCRMEQVTSLAEVWIEIDIIEKPSSVNLVTSLAEVWIEIRLPSWLAGSSPSLPLRKCGLKWIDCCRCVSGWGHFPCGSVDWNTIGTRAVTNGVRSLPLRKCGLKFFSPSPYITSSPSLPLRKCGLKCHLPGHHLHCLRHFPCGSVDWNCHTVGSGSDGVRHFPCGSVDWNIQICREHIIRNGHFPCGSVDWNENDDTFLIGCFVTSLAEVWIEIRKSGREL